MKRIILSHEFVDAIPSDPDYGIVYISIRYRTAVHRCPCGCGNKVITPIKPAKWHLHFDGDSVSLSPSVGNWQFPCRSHYWIRNNEIQWAAQWTDEEIRDGQESDSRELRRYYEDRTRDKATVPDESVGANKRRGFPSRLWQWIRGR